MNQLKFVVTGHVDHGKSTFIGRLLYDTDSVPESIMKDVKQISKELGREMEFAYLIDSLKEEKEQNITIDTSQIFFSSSERDYVIIDAPGHVEFMKNMVTGASRAEAAILILDAVEGIQEQTKRHAYVLSLLGIKQIILVINKFDKLDYDHNKFETTKTDILDFLDKLNIKPVYVIPISAAKGDNIVQRSEKISWYEGPTVLEALDTLKSKISPVEKPLRLPLQGVYEIDGRTLAVGRIDSGVLKSGQDIMVNSQVNGKVNSIEVWQNRKDSAQSGESIGLDLDVPVNRGDVVHAGMKPQLSDEFVVSLFWLSNVPIKLNETAILRCATQEAECSIVKINKLMNSSTLEEIKGADGFKATQAGEVVIKLSKPIVFESFDHIESLGRFIIEKNGAIVGGGIIPKCN